MRAVALFDKLSVLTFKEATMRVNWKTYNPGKFFDEIISTPGYARKPARGLASYLRSLTHAELLEKKTAADLAIKTMGISFTVYSDAGNIDREWPFDIIPRIIAEKNGIRRASDCSNDCELSTVLSMTFTTTRKFSETK